MYFSKLISTIFIVLLLTGCLSEKRYDQAIQLILSDEVRTLSNQTKNLIIDKDYDAIKELLHDDLLTDAIDETLINVLDYVPKGELIEHKIIGYNQSTMKSMGGIDRTDHALQFQFQYSDSWMLLSLTFREEYNEFKILRLNVNIIPDDLKEIHKFDITTASLKNITYLIALIIIPVFIVYTFVQAFKIRKTLLRSKRWLFFILIGFGSLGLNWTTGIITIEYFSFGLLGAGGVSGGPYAPWIFGIYFPLGATLFWIFKNTGKLKLKDDIVEEAENPAI